MDNGALGWWILVGPWAIIIVGFGMIAAAFVVGLSLWLVNRAVGAGLDLIVTRVRSRSRTR